MDVEEIYRSGMLQRIVQKYHLQKSDADDIVSTLLLAWLDDSESIDRAVGGGYLLQFVSNAVRNQVLKMKGKRKKELLKDVWDDEIKRADS